MAADGVKRKISAILSADVVGYSKLMEADEETTVRTMESYRETISSLIEQHNGCVVDSPGDNILSEFPSVVESVQCAVEIQHVIKAKNAVIPEARRMDFRIGIHLGDVIEEKERIYGDGVNIAARIESIADAGGICISESAYQQIKSKLVLGYEDLGEHAVKNISDPVRVYRIPMDSADANSGIAKKTLKRYQWVAIIVAVAFMAGIGAVKLWDQSQKEPKDSAIAREELIASSFQKAESATEQIPAIAVLPFNNISGDPEQEYFADGVTDNIINELSMWQIFRVIARNSTFFYKGKQRKIRQIGKELNAMYIIVGSVRKSASKIRVTAQLINAETEGQIWADTYDRELEDIFAIQDEISQQIVNALGFQFGEAEMARAKRTSTANLSAWDSVMRGAAYGKEMTREGIEKAEQMCERAIEIDPEYALGYFCMGSVHHGRFIFWGGGTKSLDLAFKYLRKSISLDDKNFMAHTILANCYKFKGEYNLAVAEIERALSLNPSDSGAYLFLCSINNQLGRPEKALEAITRAMQLNPMYDVGFLTELAWTYRGLGKYKEALSTLDKAIARNPDYPMIYWEQLFNYREMWFLQHSNSQQALDNSLIAAKKLTGMGDNYLWHLSLCHLDRKEYDDALAGAERLLSVSPNEPGTLILKATIYNAIGRADESIRIIEGAMAKSIRVEPWHLNALGSSYSLTGQYTKALASYSKALELNPNRHSLYDARIGLAAINSKLSQIEEAEIHATEILKLIPHFSVDVWGKRNPTKDRDQVERDMAVLRKAGLK